MLVPSLTQSVDTKDVPRIERDGRATFIPGC